MLATCLSLLAALAYGTSDFLGGVLSGRIKPWTVALWGQAAAFVAVSVAALVRGGAIAGSDVAWAVLAGVGNGLGTAFLYRGLSSGRMGVVAPVSGVTTALVPVLAGLATGERPALVVWLGILLALPAIWLVAKVPTEVPGHPAGHGRAGVVDGAIAGLGFGTSFAAIAQVSEAAGLWPVSVQMLVSFAVLVVGTLLAREPLVPPRRYAPATFLPGLLGASALVLFLVASQHGHLTVTGVISSLYPAMTVLLAAAVLKERIHGGQGVGLGLCAAAVALVAVG